ncbi:MULTISPECIES: hydroxyisourate hydrolase [unclassified Paenibacillus]|uniref:5-hydroxyisourate hydrolase n=1 Tax=Paenibacillus provencensis TaxID=441151 RepID=A0ABW3PSR9_9BACL|nr:MULTISPECIES: hydroxyisourate hydrolase [unclassified Paenibacillus]MCM3126781.1 hydroxyisourate hydrolase [Paenibacillus sp. MER 78]SFS57895.1 5-hydroxyisourate hydrolase [Paenibacillus sp. 453mf]
MAGKLTTHVLDTSRGIPGRSMKVELYFIESTGEAKYLVSALTNDDGRIDAPFLEEELTSGTYELRFYVREYFESFLNETGIRSIWDVIPLRFFVANGEEHYHVPLLVSPGGYSTYRGS